MPSHRGFVLFVLLLLAGCAAPDGRGAKLLDETTPKFSYRQLYIRARAQSSIALEAFYSDAWMELEDSAKAIEQAARLMPGADDVPAHLKDRLLKDCTSLRQDAAALAEYARMKNAKSANEAMQRIQLTIRELKTYE